MNTNTNKEEKWIKEFSRMKARKERANAGMCATCGSKENHNERGEFGTFTHQWDSGVDARVWDEIDFIRTLLTTHTEQKVREVVEKLEGMKKESKHELGNGGTIHVPSARGYNQALDDIIKTLTRE